MNLLWSKIHINSFKKNFLEYTHINIIDSFNLLIEYFMIIGIDLRFLENNTYSNFAKNLVKNLIHTQSDVHFNIYTKNPDLFDVDTKNCHVKFIDIDCWSLTEQTKFLKILKNDKNTLMLFFDYNKPLYYNWEYYTILSWLKDIFYQNFSNYFHKYKYLYLLEKNLKKSKKILCFDENTKDELIERFNINQEKINLLDGFFLENTFHSEDKDISLDIKTKFQIWEKYFIYSWGDGIEKNLDRLIHVFHRLHKENFDLGLIFLWDKIWKNIELRNHVIENGLQKHIHFIDSVKPWEEQLLYQQSLAVIFPSLYESFPFRLSNPMILNIPILASKLHNIENIFEDKIEYFSPISTSSILNTIKNFTEKKSSQNYSSILEKNNIQHTTKQLIDIIR